MQILKADVLGFCFGVRRAVELAEKALNQNQDNKVYSLGPLIHNENTLQVLENKGLQIIQENQINLIPENSTVIIRAHGVSPLIINQLEEKKCNIIDATCPRVKASQKMVERYTNQNDFVILTGDKNHGEVIGIAGYAGKNFSLIQDSLEAEKFELKNDDKINVILLSQTTYSPNEFEKIQTIFKSRFKNFAVMNTICPATEERQNALKQLCTKVEGVLVIGGKSSANTKRLFVTAQENCKNAAYIQSYLDIPDYFYNLNSVGITAGASTPDDIIQEVIEKLSKS